MKNIKTKYVKGGDLVVGMRIIPLGVRSSTITEILPHDNQEIFDKMIYLENLHSEDEFSGRHVPIRNENLYIVIDETPKKTSVRVDQILNSHFVGKIITHTDFLGDGITDREYFKRFYPDFEFGGVIESVYFSTDEDTDPMIVFNTTKGSVKVYGNDTIHCEEV